MKLFFERSLKLPNHGAVVVCTLCFGKVLRCNAASFRPPPPKKGHFVVSPRIVDLVLCFSYHKWKGQLRLNFQPAGTSLTAFSPISIQAAGPDGALWLYCHILEPVRPGSFSVHSVGFACLPADPMSVKGTRHSTSNCLYVMVFSVFASCVFLPRFPLL